MLIISYFLITVLVISIIIMLLFKSRLFFSQQEQRKPSPSGQNEFSQELSPQGNHIQKTPLEKNPDSTQKEHMVLLVKNPTCLYAYAPPSLKWGSGTPVLRVYQITDHSEDGAKFLFELNISPDSNRWFINVPDDNSGYYVVLGELKEDGSFYPLLRSNDVETPRASLSTALDASWIPCDIYQDLENISYGFSSAMTQGSERTDH